MDILDLLGQIKYRSMQIWIDIKLVSNIQGEGWINRWRLGRAMLGPRVTVTDPQITSQNGSTLTLIVVILINLNSKL